MVAKHDDVLLLVSHFGETSPRQNVMRFEVFETLYLQAAMWALMPLRLEHVLFVLSITTPTSIVLPHLGISPVAPFQSAVSHSKVKSKHPPLLDPILFLRLLLCCRKRRVADYDRPALLVHQLPHHRHRCVVRRLPASSENLVQCHSSLQLKESNRNRSPSMFNVQCSMVNHSSSSPGGLLLPPPPLEPPPPVVSGSSATMSVATYFTF